MSGSTRAPSSAPLPQTLGGSHTEADASDDASQDGIRGDGYVDRLGDRLSSPPALANHDGAAPPMPVMARSGKPLSNRRSVPPPRTPSEGVPPPGLGSMIPPRETSDVRPMPPVERDELGEHPPSPPSYPPEPFSEFEQDDLASESTSIDDRDALATESTQILREMPSMPLLFVESGRDQGREYVLVEGETTVGRGIDNEVILADVSVSRRHLRVLRDGDSLQLRDAGSGNGTLVNGRRVHAVALSDGDRIELGETVLVVRVPGAELAMSFPHEQDVLRTMDNTTDETAVPMAGPSFDQSLPPHDGSWSLPPPASSLPPSAPSATSWIGAGGERTSSIVLDRRTLLIVGAVIAIGASVLSALVVAVVLRQSEPTPVASTLPHEPGAPIAVPPLALAPSPAVPTVVAPTPQVPPTPQVAPTANVEEPTPTEPNTEARADPNTEARAEPESRREVRAQSTPVREVRAQTTPVREARPERTSRERAPREVPAPRARPRVADAAYLAAYRSGDFATASREARSAGQAARALHIDQFATHYRTAQSAAAGSAAATRAIERAIALDNQIVPGGHYGARLRDQLVSAYLASAQTSMGARPQEACRQVQLALRLEARNARGLVLGRQCETQAQRLLGEAASVERSDPARARALYQAVMPMVPSSSATYTRARQRVDAIGRARGVDEDE